MRPFSPELAHALAAEYVLGTLRGRARARFATLARADAALAAVLAEWENALTPLAAGIPAIEPPERVWQAIERRIAPRDAARAPSFWESLAFWRFAGAGLAAAVLALLLVIGGQQGAPDGPTLVSVLATPDQDVRMVIERHAMVLKVRMVKPWVTMPGQDLELWVVPRDGKPRSLGVVPFDRDSEIRPASLDAKLLEGVAFAVSKEPRGGSPTGAPTGPIVCSGAIARPTRA